MSLWSGFIKSLSKLSMIGRALMLPISLLPAAGLLLAFGDKFHMPLMMNAGGIIFDNLPMLFAIGSAVGLASESGIAALSAAVSVFITNITISTVLGITPEMASQGRKIRHGRWHPDAADGGFRRAYLRYSRVVVL